MCIDVIDQIKIVWNVLVVLVAVHNSITSIEVKCTHIIIEYIVVKLIWPLKNLH